MKRSLWFIAIGAIASFFLNASAYAACSGSSPNLTAASANRSDVADCVAASTYGDTIVIPACAAGNCVWTSGIDITKDIKIVGAGIDTTILTLGFADNSTKEAFLKFTPDATSRNNLQSLSGTHIFEVSGITFAGNNRMAYKYGMWIYNSFTPVIKRVNIHHNKFNGIHRAVEIYGYTHGVFHNNTLINTNASYPQGAGLDAFTYDVKSAGSSANWYIEDNTFSFSINDGVISGAANNGGGYVARYNTVTGATALYFDIHSNQGAGIKGGQVVEIYGNDLGSSTTQNGMALRGGKDIIFNNKLKQHGMEIYEEHADAISGLLPANQCPSTPNGLCTGTSTPYACCTGAATGTCGPQICLDTCNCWKVNHSYIWNNRDYTTNAIWSTFIRYDTYDNVVGHDNGPSELVENREFWTQRATGTFDGTGDASSGGGVGCGTLASRPATCTTGVGYWATGQSCSDLTGMVGANPSTPISGTLYRCTTTNTWTAYYTPYTYPHPLRQLSLQVYNKNTFANGNFWTILSGKAYTYALQPKRYSGTNIYKVTQDGSSLLKQGSSVDLCESTKGSYFVNTSDGTLYVHSTDDANPNMHSIEVVYK